MDTRNLRRKENYKKLRKAGFNYRHATLLKDQSRAKVHTLCEIHRKHHNSLIDDIFRVTGRYIDDLQ